MITSFKDNKGNWDGTRLTVFASFCFICISGACDQFFGYKVNETVFCTFAGIVVSGLGFTTFTAIKQNKNENIQ